MQSKYFLRKKKKRWIGSRVTNLILELKMRKTLLVNSHILKYFNVKLMVFYILTPNLFSAQNNQPKIHPKTGKNNLIRRTYQLSACHTTRTRYKKENHLFEKKKKKMKGHNTFTVIQEYLTNFHKERSDQIDLSYLFLMISQPFWSCQSQVL